MFLPQDSIRNFNDFDTEPTSFARAVTDSVENAAFSGITTDAVLRGTQALFPGKSLTSEEYRKSPYYRPGIDYPKGVGENIASMRASLHDKQQQRNLELNSASQSLLERGGVLAGSLLGTALDPLTDASFYAAPELVGLLKPTAMISKAAQFGEATELATKIGLGATEGSTGALLPSLANYDEQNQTGMNPEIADIFENLGMGAGFGGAIRGVFGFHDVITPQAHMKSQEVAVNQMGAGKSVNVQDIIRQGFYEAGTRKEDMGQILETLEQYEPIIKDGKKAIENKIASLTEEFKNRESLEKTNAFLNSLKEIEPNLENLTSEKQLNEAMQAINTPKFFRDANQNVLLKNLPSNEEFQKALDIIQKPGFLQDAGEKSFIKSILRGDEKKLIKERLEKHQSELDEINERLSQINKEKAPKKHEKLSLDLEAKKEQIMLAEKRINEIEGKNIRRTPSQKIKQDIENLMRAKNAMEHVENESEILSAQALAKPANLDSIKQNSEHVNSYKGDSTYNENREKAYQDEIMATPDNSITEQEVNNLKEQTEGMEKLPEEEQALLDIEEEERQLNTVKNAIRKLVACMRENP